MPHLGIAHHLTAPEPILRSSSPGRADRKGRPLSSTTHSYSEGEGRLLLLLCRHVAKGEAPARHVGREVLVLILLLAEVRLEDLDRLRCG